MTLRPAAVRPLLALLVMSVVGFWYTPVTLGITDLDEGLYAACAREMARTGDWVTPRINGEPFYEKPPLLYWFSAVTIRLLGPTERAVRLPSALSATLLVFLTYAFGARYLGRRAAIIAASGLALAPMTVAAGRLATTDAALCLLLSLCLFSAYRASTATTERIRWWTIVSFAAAGLGALAKGAPAVVFPILIIGIYHLTVNRTSWRRLLRSMGSLGTAVGILIFVAVVAPWHFAAWQSNGQPFVDEYIMRQHIGRFRGGDTAHHAPVWFFVPAFLAGFFPWSFFTVPAMLGRLRRNTLPEDEGQVSDGAAQADCRAYLRIWLTVVFIVFSVGGSKLVSYILPLYPAAALLAGDWLARSTARSANPLPVAVLSILSAAFLGTMFLALLYPSPIIAIINRYADRPVMLSDLDSEVLRLASYLVGILALGVLIMAALAARRKLSAAPVILAATMACFWVVLLHAGVPMAQAQVVGPLHALAKEAGELAGPSGTVIVALPGPRRPSVLFYMPDAVMARRAVHETDAGDPGDLAAELTRLRSYAEPSSPVLVLARDDSILTASSAPFRAAMVRRAAPYFLVKLVPMAASHSSPENEP